MEKVLKNNSEGKVSMEREEREEREEEGEEKKKKLKLERDSGDSGGGVSKGVVSDKDRKKYVSQRDYELLKFCFDQYFLSRKQIGQWLKLKSNISSEKALAIITKRVMNFLLKSHFLAAQKASVLKCQEVYCVTKDGFLLLMDCGLLPDFASYVIIDKEKINHDSATTDIRLVWEEIAKIESWTSDRLLRTDDNDHIPDAEMVYYSAKKNQSYTFAIEVELSQKSQERYRRKFESYQASSFSWVFYFALCSKLQGKLLEYSKGVTNKVFVCTIKDFLQKKSEAVLVSNAEQMVIGSRFLQEAKHAQRE